ncbi:MAG: SIMPL domain-containing protein, partial [Ilumatobacteraceae bacterium]
VRALDRVGEMIGAAVTDCGANVRDLSWRVDADNPARRALLGEAAVDARVRAQAYVAALGVTLGAVESISELPPVAAPPAGSAPMAMRAMAKGADSAELSVSGGRIELTAAVYVQFALLP